MEVWNIRFGSREIDIGNEKLKIRRKSRCIQKRCRMKEDAVTYWGKLKWKKLFAVLLFFLVHVHVDVCNFFAEKCCLELFNGFFFFFCAMGFLFFCVSEREFAVCLVVLSEIYF